MSKVNVYDSEGNVVARVEYNSDLDFWDGRNWSSGGTGLHQGIAKLKDGKYVIVHGSQWQCDRAYGEIVTKDEAFQAILRSGNFKLFDDPRFRELKPMYERLDDTEEVEK